MNAKEQAVERIEQFSRSQFLTVSDIITDLMHYCEAKGYKFETALQCAKLYHEYDTKNPSI